METTQDLIQIGREHLKSLSDDEFASKYKSSKHRYQATTKSLEWLLILKDSLEHREDLDIDTDVVEDVEVVISDLNDLIERMHSASYWASESEAGYDD